MSHPPIEAVFTVDEEVGMTGAEAINLDCLDGKIMLNIDSEEEGIFLSGCAGGATLKAFYPLNKSDITGTKITIKINGLDCVSFGPDIIDIHTVKEKLDIESTRRTWELITEVLKQLA